LRRIVELAALVDDNKLKDALINSFLSDFEPIFDPEEKREFLPCEYYRIGKSYRHVLISLIDLLLAISIILRLKQRSIQLSSCATWKALLTST